MIINDSMPVTAPELNAGFRGLRPRDPINQPVGYAAAIPPANIELIPQSEWSRLIKEGEASKSFLSHIRDRGNNGGPIQSLDQNGQGYCWSYGTAAAVTLLRAKANLPHVRLSAHAVACKIKNFRDEGGWGALSLDFALVNGYPSVEAWPEKSMSRSYDTPATWADAAKYRPDEGFVDLASAVYDRDLSFAQTITCLLRRVPVVVDLDWWGHCVVACDPVETSPGQFGIRIWNSWSDSWGERGMGVLAGNKAIPSNAVAPTTTIA